MRDWTARPTASLLTLRSLALRAGPASGCLVRMGVVDELMAARTYLCFGPDTLVEASNRGYRPHAACATSAAAE